MRAAGGNLGGAKSCSLCIERRRDLIHHAFAPERIGLRANEYAANLLHGPPGAAVVRTDDEIHALHRLEGMLQHEALHLTVVSTAPMRAGQERPADFNFALHRIPAVETR